MVTGNIKRWRSGEMVLRWTAAHASLCWPSAVGTAAARSHESRVPSACAFFASCSFAPSSACSQRVSSSLHILTLRSGVSSAKCKDGPRRTGRRSGSVARLGIRPLRASAPANNPAGTRPAHGALTRGSGGGHHTRDRTGSGYSTALLAALVGARGHVVTLDIDPKVVFRVRRLVRKRGIANVTVLRGDGRRGCPTIVFDRIISWASLQSCCPDDWISQLRPGGVVVVPVRAPGDNYAVRMRLSRGRWHEDQRIPASFVPMTPVPFRPWEAGDNTPVPQYPRTD